MNMEVELVSKDSIKPSSPTPSHLKTHKLTLIDQFAPTSHFRVLLVYPSSQVDEVRAKTLVLKQSLTQTLTHFYPLAGTIKDDDDDDQVSVDCNDEGAYYVEARVKSPLSDHLNRLDAGQLVKFLPSSGGGSVTRFQQTNFACGGMVIVATVSHKVADASAFTSFLKAWASITRGSGSDHDHEHLCPNFVSNATIFRSHYNEAGAPPRELTLDNVFSHFLRTRLITTRRLGFDDDAIARLKAQAACPSLENPTRVEVVSAFLWRRLVAAFKARRSGVHKPSGITHVVNLRQRASHLFSDNSPGNILLLASSISTSDDPDLGSLATKIRQATTKIDGEIIDEILGDRALPKISEMMKEMRDEFSLSNDHMDLISFTSWCNLGLYDVDFGWGKPVRSGPLGFGRSVKIPVAFDCLVVLVDARIGKGVEAMVMVDEQDMRLLEQDQELLSYVLMDPML